MPVLWKGRADIFRREVGGRRGWPGEWVLSGFDRHKFYMVGHRMKFYEIITRDIVAKLN
jgi:hypothetical protein